MQVVDFRECPRIFREQTLIHIDECNKTGVLLPGFKDFGVQVATYDSLKKSHKELLRLEKKINVYQ